jgi:GT2 family glycosyltransferase
MPPSARVIVTAYENVPSLRLALRGYLRQTTRDFGLTVADDGSGPSTRAFIEGFGEEARSRGIDYRSVWHEDRGFRRAAIANAAVRSTQGEDLLIFVDGDCIPPAHFVEHHLRVHEPWSFHVGGAYRLSEAESSSITEADVDTGRFESLHGPEHARQLRRLRRKSHWGTLLRRRRRPKVLGLNVAMDRSLFVALNGYDERFTEYGMEDTDLGDRAMRLRPRPRVKNLYTQCDVWHLWHPTNPGGRAGGLAIYRQHTHPPRCEFGLEQAPLPGLRAM